MSYIFDALQRSETERTGVEFPSFSEATELLEATEQALAKHPQIAASLDEVPEEQTATTLAPAASAIEMSQIETPQRELRIDQFTQFQSLKILVPPQSRLVCLTEKESLAAEKLRFLAVRLRQLQQKRLLKKLLITSTIPEEGKSMIAANLGCALTRKAQKVLLIDGDLRRPSIAKLFGLGKIPGLGEWLRGEQGANASIYYLENPGLWILPAGNLADNPLELMQSGKMSALVDQLTSWFDWIVIDSPPVLPLGDTSVWMRLADGILLVARQGISEKQQLKKGLEAIEPVKLIGAVVNSATNAAHNGYYAYYQSAAKRA